MNTSTALGKSVSSKDKMFSVTVADGTVGGHVICVAELCLYLRRAGVVFKKNSGFKQLHFPKIEHYGNIRLSMNTTNLGNLAPNPGRAPHILIVVEDFGRW